MRLTDLEPTFLTVSFPIDTWTVVDDLGTTSEKTGPRQHHHHVAELAGAQGVMFLCPKCTAAGGAGGVHQVLVWFRDRGVPAEAEPAPGRWVVSGSGYGDLTLSPSIDIKEGCKWHGYVTNGEVTNA